jgi:hypothetical protein
MSVRIVDGEQDEDRSSFVTLFAARVRNRSRVC